MSYSGVTEWLKLIKMQEYQDSFIDNGYDDLETVKLIKRKDVEAIGVNEDHQEYMLESVKALREKGATWVYLLDYENLYAPESDNDYCSISDTYACEKSSGVESYKSSVYQQSDETFSDTGSQSDEKRSSQYIPELHFQGNNSHKISLIKLLC